MSDRWIPFDSRATRPAAVEQLAQAKSYRGPLTSLPADEAMRQLVDLLAYFGFDRPGDLPAPTVGTKGDPIAIVDKAVLAAMRQGISHLHALGSRRSRAQVECYMAAERAVDEVANAIFERRHDEVVAAAVHAAEQAAEAPRRARRDDQMVYFVIASDETVKIGVARDPRARVKALQTSHAMELRLAAVTKGGVYQERRYHERFGDRRLVGEWFSRCPEIDAEVRRLRKRDPLCAKLGLVD